MGVVRCKPNVLIGNPAPAGFRILSALDQVAMRLPYDLVITSGRDGLHSGLMDPHHSGEAYDVRSHDLDPIERSRVLYSVMFVLGIDHFYGFLEDAGTSNEHFHFQRAKDTVYPPPGKTLV